MSSIKDLFGSKSNKVLPGKSLGDLVTGSGVESAGYIEKDDDNKRRFEPRVDFSQVSNFARYGSAEKYYEDAIDHISYHYPYDGSGKEKITWHLSSSYFDNYIFENEYPRTNGYITLGLNYDFNADGLEGYDTSTRNEWVSFRGGPHTASGGMTGKPLSTTFTGSNYYSDTTRESNLELDGANGITLEFWINKQTFDAGNESRRQVIFDSWNDRSHNGGLPTPSDYGRFRVEISGSGVTGEMPPVFHVELFSGSDGLCNGIVDVPPMIPMTATTLTGSWNHFALSFINTDIEMLGTLYQNGTEVFSVEAGTPMGKVTGSMFGRVGALETSVMDLAGGDLGSAGDAKLSASLDEVRFWKTKRTETEIGRYWFTQVNAGTNTDIANVDLGVYYKFNEGIVDTTSVAPLDTRVLDYSGRISNGSWTGYQVGSRFTGSAMVEAGAALTEFKDPIIYQSNPLVAVYKSTQKNIGYDYDVRNNAGIYTSIPEYITGDPVEVEGETLKKLTQIMGSYFDSLQLQIEAMPRIKDVEYTSGSQKVAPFVNRFLEGVGLYAPEIFADAGALEYYASRDDFIEFSKKLSDTKNRLYENIYNNIVNIFKTKGTEESFRNLMRCYGVDEPLMKISLYGDEVTQELRTNTRNTAARKVFVDFNNVDRFDSTVYQQTASADTDTRNFITASSDMEFIPKTMQAEAIFPKKFKRDSELYFRTPFVSCSLFGAHTPITTDQTDLTWQTPDISNFQVFAVRTEEEGDDVYFQLSSSIHTGGVIPNITSSVFTNVYDNSKWNLAVRVKPETNYAPGLSGSQWGSASVEFIGYNSLGDNVENNFYLTASIPMASGSAFLSSSTRIYVGAHRENFTGSQLHWSDAKISSTRYWIDNLPNEAIEAHSKDASSFGPLEPHKSAYLVKNSWDFFQQIQAPQSKTLALSWTFDTVTGSGDSSTGSPTLSDATFFVPDMTSGSVALTSRYGWLGPVVNMRHPGKGDFFLPFDANAVNREYVYSAKQLAPEILNSSNMIEVRTQDDNIFTRETRPQNYFYAIEKSQAAIISEEMMKWFATIKDFNFLIGDPVNRYRQEYKTLAQMRELYFRTVGNTMSFERFVEFFKWVDSALSEMLLQLVPASANFADKVRTMIESHVLERSKYWSKFPTLEMKLDDPEAGLRGIVEGVYPWKRGHAPLPVRAEGWRGNTKSLDLLTTGIGPCYPAVHLPDPLCKNDSDWTATFWFKVEPAAGAQTIISRRFDGNSAPILGSCDWEVLALPMPSTDVTFRVYDTSAAFSAITWPGAADGEWHLMIISFDAATTEGWTWMSGFPAFFSGFNMAQPPEVNALAKLSLGAAYDDATTPGCSPGFGFQPFFGSVDEVAIWDGVFVNADIPAFTGCPSDLINDMPPGWAYPLISWYRLGDDPLDNASMGGTIVDVAGTNDGTIVGDTPTGFAADPACLPASCAGCAPALSDFILPQNKNCFWAHNRASGSTFPSGDSIIDAQRDIFRLSDDFRPNAKTPTLTDISTTPHTQYQGSAYALRNLTQPYRFKAKEMHELKGGSNVARIKNVQYAHTELPFGVTTQLKVLSSEVESDIDCNDVVDPNDKVKLRYKLTNNPIGYKSGKGDLFAPFDLYESSIGSGYLSGTLVFDPLTTPRQFSLENYHNDFYGTDNETPMQGPFTEKYVGGWVHRHVPFPDSDCPFVASLGTGSLAEECRPEAWNMETPDSRGCVLDNKFSMKLFPPDPWFGGPHKAVELPDVSRLSDPTRCFIGNESGWASLGAEWSVAMWFKVEQLPINDVMQVLMARTPLGSGPPFYPDGYDFHVNVYVQSPLSVTPQAKIEYYSWHDDFGGGTVTKLETSFELIENSIADGKWHLVCFGVIDGGIFLDLDSGAEHYTTILNGPKIGTDVGDCKVGIGAYWAGGSAWSNQGGVENMYVDEVSLWNTYISAFDINEIWNDGSPECLSDHHDYEDVISWYRMGDAPGDDCTDGGPIIDVATGTEAIHNNGICANTDGTQFSNDVAPVELPTLSLSARTAHQPRSTILREPLAKRPVNIRNIKQTTGSTVIGNYSHEYEVLQTSGRKINNRFFVKNDGFVPEYNLSPWVAGMVDYVLPDFSKYGATKNIFVERFNAPGGPDVSSRGVLDLYSEEYAVGNDLNYRNMAVRGPLNEWSTEHCGQFGIQSVSGAIEGYRQPRTENYNTLASYYKVNRNAGTPYMPKNNYDREVAWVDVVNADLSNYGTFIFKTTVGFWWEATAKGTEKLSKDGYLSFNLTDAYDSNGYRIGLSTNPGVGLDAWEKMEYAIEPWVQALEIKVWELGSLKFTYTPYAVPSDAYGDRYRILRKGGRIYYQRSVNKGATWTTFYESESIPSTADLYPSYNQSFPPSFENYGAREVRISNPQYDNWFVQHPIPQNDLQYQWISLSYNSEVDQPWGHAGSPNCGRSNYCESTGSLSTGSLCEGNEIEFVSASTWNFPGIADGEDYLVNFSNMIPMLPTSVTNPLEYKYGLFAPLFAKWTELINMVASPDGKTVTKTSPTMGGPPGWDGHARSDTPFPTTEGYIEFTLPTPLVADSYNWFGINDNPPASIYWGPSCTNNCMPFSMQNDFLGQIDVYERDVLEHSTAAGFVGAGQRLRITRTPNNRIVYQSDYGTSGETWTTFYESTKTPPSALMYPDIVSHAKDDSISIVISGDGKFLLSPGHGYDEDWSIFAEGTINSYFNNINGPYGYPSWKQIRTGETPVARYQKNNNIISFKKEVDIYGSNEITPANAGLTRDTLIQFVEPPVTFRYKPLRTTLMLTSSTDPLTLNNVYGNNVGGFPNPDINNFLGTSIKCEEQMFDRLKDLYHNAPSDSPVSEMVTLNYNEVVYPREIHAGLKKYRQRTEYAEVALGTPVYENGEVVLFSASLSDGINGIDRGPLYRRTFWRDYCIFRNRRAGASLDPLGGPSVTGTLPNSQGHYDGFATSVNSWGNKPMTLVTAFKKNPAEPISGSIEGWGLSGSIWTDPSGPPLGSYTTKVSPNNAEFCDTGELNSCISMRFSGYVGTAEFGGSYYGKPTFDGDPVPLPQLLTWYPTASCFYFHHQRMGWDVQSFATSSLGLRWRVAELSGKNPWFDTYEDYVQDIRGTAKNFTIVPEFRISQHMDYYADGMFRKQNDQILTLDGAASPTASALVVTQSDLSRGFDQEFFSEYSNTDFQKYFGKISSDNSTSQITLKCNAVKKLLPYHGFYPSHRTLQVASLFSQSIAPYIGGIKWSDGATTDDPLLPPSGALAVQSLLQPYYAPGILYNTIKSGIACDWPSFTGSAAEPEGSDQSQWYLDRESNYRIPFESILEPLSDVGLPVSSSDGEGALYLLYPTYQITQGAELAFPVSPRSPYVDLDNIQRVNASTSKKYAQYKLAINNFMAEIPNFFLQDQQLKTVTSKRAGEVSLIPGQTYYMDVYLKSSTDCVMIEDYWNGYKGMTDPVPTNSPWEPIETLRRTDRDYCSFNGRYFGPPSRAGGSVFGDWGSNPGLAPNALGDPAYAPYTPPYFYGKSVVTIAYTADEGDDSGEFTYKKLFEKANITQRNATMERMFDVSAGPDHKYAPALSGAMPLSSSFNLFGLFSPKETTQDKAANLIAVVDSPDQDRAQWVISPKMETPVLNFKDSPEQHGWGRGMWSTYGVVPDKNSIVFGIEETYKSPPLLRSKTTTTFSVMWTGGAQNVDIVYNDFLSSVTKNDSAFGWGDAGAAGSKTLEPNGYWQFTIDNISSGAVGGLNQYPDDAFSYTDMNYAIQTCQTSSFVDSWTNEVCVDVSTPGELEKIVGGGCIDNTWDAAAYGNTQVDLGGAWEFEISSAGVLMRCGLVDITTANPSPRIPNYFLQFSDVGSSVIVMASDQTSPGIVCVEVLCPDAETFIVGDKFRIFLDRAGYIHYQKLTGVLWVTFFTMPDPVSEPLWPSWMGYGDSSTPPGSKIINIVQESAPKFNIWESGVLVKDQIGSYLVDDKIRIVHTSDNLIQYQHSSGTTEVWGILYESTKSTEFLTLYPDVALRDDGVGSVGITAVIDSISEAFQYPASQVSRLLKGSLIQACFKSPEEKQIGEVAVQKQISEAIVAIPFAVRGYAKESRYPETTVAMDKNFFKIDSDKFEYYRDWFMQNKNAEVKTSPAKPSQSIQKMLTLMDKYIIPPELDFLTFNQGSLKVDPFVMYLFEFNHTLSQQDLADIWQGVMPDISRIAQLSDTTVDDNVFTHATGPDEFYGGEMLPDDIRWMVFKVKKRANFDYFKMTADTSDDAKFDFKFNVGGVELPYSYNWPYDYCSLVELAELEVQEQLVPYKPVAKVAGEDAENPAITRFVDHFKAIATGEEEE